MVVLFFALHSPSQLSALLPITPLLLFPVFCAVFTAGFLLPGCNCIFSAGSCTCFLNIYLFFLLPSILLLERTLDTGRASGPVAAITNPVALPTLFSPLRSRCYWRVFLAFILLPLLSHHHPQSASLRCRFRAALHGFD